MTNCASRRLEGFRLRFRPANRTRPADGRWNGTLVPVVRKENEMNQPADMTALLPLPAPAPVPPALPARPVPDAAEEEEQMIKYQWTKRRARIRAAAKAYLESTHADH